MTEKITTHCQHELHNPLTWCGRPLEELGIETYDSWEVSNCFACLRAYLAWLLACLATKNRERQ